MKRLICKSQRIYLKDILKQWNDPQYEMVYDTDYYNRKNVFIIFDGRVYEADTHENAIRKAGYEYDDSFPFIAGSVLVGTDNKTYVAIYPNTAQDITISEAANILKKYYPNAIICTDTQDSINEDAYIETV